MPSEPTPSSQSRRNWHQSCNRFPVQSKELLCQKATFPRLCNYKVGGKGAHTTLSLNFPGEQRSRVGLEVGTNVGTGLGSGVGAADGSGVGVGVGPGLGSGEGELEGSGVGTGVGA